METKKNEHRHDQQGDGGRLWSSRGLYGEARGTQHVLRVRIDAAENGVSSGIRARQIGEWIRQQDIEQFDIRRRLPWIERERHSAEELIVDYEAAAKEIESVAVQEHCIQATIRQDTRKEQRVTGTPGLVRVIECNQDTGSSAGHRQAKERHQDHCSFHYGLPPSW